MSSPREAFPIDVLLPEVVQSLSRSRCLVIEAPPGAGKTTRVPEALYRATPSSAQQVVVTEPRRLAARLAATYVAKEMGSALGDVVGYSVRFEDKTSARTRVRYVTEGVLLQELCRAPALEHVHTVILDEFHERHLVTDELLALVRRTQRQRPDLRLVVMSATLEGEAIARYLGDCPRLRSEGKRFPVTIEHDNTSDDRPLDKRVASAVRTALHDQPSGDVLVFLPGVREIHHARDALSGGAAARDGGRDAGHNGGGAGRGHSGALRASTQHGVDFELHVLHGELPIAEQANAVRPGERRKVVLATNVAESSVTVAGVTAVVDAGLARVAGVSAWSGQSTLSVQEVSQASAIQRAGRAGRTREGRVYRLYSEANFKRRPERDVPEIGRLDLTELVLQLGGMGLAAGELHWLDAPPERALETATEVLRRLGALDATNKLSAVGQRMLDFSVPPRLARLIVSGEQFGVENDACLAAALLSERDIRLPPRGQVWDLATSLSDVQDRIDAFAEAEYDDFRPSALRSIGLEQGRVHSVRQARDQLKRRARARGTLPPAASTNEAETRLRRCFLHAFNDRVALHQPAAHRLILKNGTQATVSPLSVVRHAPFVVAIEVEDRSQTLPGQPAGAQGGRGGARVQWLSAIEPDWLLEDYGDELTTSEELVFNVEKLRVETLSRLSYGSVTLDETRARATPSAAAGALLYDAAIQRKASLLGKRSSLEQLLCRVALLREQGFAKELPPLEALNDATLLQRACEECTSFEELEQVDLSELALRDLSTTAQSLLRKETPDFVTLSGGRRVQVNYELGKPPWIASRLQDFFGMGAGPTVCAGRLPLTLHLLAPNQRAVQVTSDLAGFWVRHYPEIKKQLCRRYPRHSWPEDGRTATAPAPKPPRG